MTLDATDDISGVKEIHYRINDDEWNTYYGDFLTFVLDYDCLKNASIEYYSVDNAENQEETKILEGIYIDQEPPYFDAQYEILSGNPKDGWLIGVNASNIIDDCSGWSGRVEFLLNGVLQDTVTGPEPEYMWQFYYSGGLQIIVGVRVCDNAGNCVTKEFEIKLSRNKNHLFMDQMFLRFLDRFPLILRILNI